MFEVGSAFISLIGGTEMPARSGSATEALCIIKSDRGGGPGGGPSFFHFSSQCVRAVATAKVRTYGVELARVKFMSHRTVDTAVSPTPMCTASLLSTPSGGACVRGGNVTGFRGTIPSDGR